jgi:hypothetical protein
MTVDEREANVAVAHAHAAAEADGDIEQTMATLDEDPVYELQPMGLSLRGRAAARGYYEYFFAEFMPRISGYDLRSEWVTDEGLGQEYVIHVDNGDGSTTHHPIIGILTFGTGGKLSGERLYASEELIRMMFGPVLGQAAPTWS